MAFNSHHLFMYSVLKNYFKHFAVYHMLNSQLINVIDKGNKQMA